MRTPGTECVIAWSGHGFAAGCAQRRPWPQAGRRTGGPTVPEAGAVTPERVGELEPGEPEAPPYAGAVR
jgi:hypothetical protein